MVCGTCLGSPVGNPPHLGNKGLPPAPASRSVQPLGVRGGVAGSLQGGCRAGARDGGARERAPGGTRKRRAPARGALGVAGGARGRVSARERRARPRGPRREKSRRREPSPQAGTLRRRLCAAARPREGASERASGRQLLAPEGPNEVGAAGSALGLGPEGEVGETARAGPSAPAAETPGRIAPPPSLRGGEAAAVAARWVRGGGGLGPGAREGRFAEAAAGGRCRVEAVGVCRRRACEGPRCPS